jgi:hypothetical protein
MNQNYDRLESIKTALGNMKPGAARDILSTFNDTCGLLTRLVESLQCEGTRVKGDAATALSAELSLAEEALNVLYGSALPEMILNERATNPSSALADA